MPSTRRPLSCVLGLFALAAFAACGSSSAKEKADRDLEEMAIVAPPGKKPPAKVTKRTPEKKPAKKPAPKRLQPPSELGTMRVRADAIRSQDDFVALARKSGGEELVRLLIDLRSDAIVYFNPRVFALHADFVLDEVYREPPSPAALKRFAANFGPEKSEFLLCDLVRTANGTWTLSFWEGDRPIAEHVKRAYRKVAGTFYAPKDLYFRPLNKVQAKAARELGKSLRVIAREEVHAKLERPRVSQVGKAVGVLRVVGWSAGDEHVPSFTSGHIVVLKDPMPFLPPVAGVVSQSFSHPLANAALRAESGGIPHAFAPDFGKQHLVLQGSKVVLEVAPSGVSLRKASAADLARASNGKPELLEANTTIADVRKSRFLRRKHADTFGFRAANIGAMSKGCRDISVADGFALPFHFHHAHFAKSGLAERARQLAQDPRIREEPDYLRGQLAKLRKEVEDSELPRTLAEQLRLRLRAMHLGPERQVLASPSLNVDGLPAGEALRGKWVRAMPPAMEVAVRQLWARAFDDELFQACLENGIDPAQLAVAVVFQESPERGVRGTLTTATRARPMAGGELYQIIAEPVAGPRQLAGRPTPERVYFDASKMKVGPVARDSDDDTLVYDAEQGLRYVRNTARRSPALDNIRAWRVARVAGQVEACVGKTRPLSIDWAFDGQDVVVFGGSGVAIR